MGGCDLVRKGGPAFDLRIGGRRVTTGRIPGGWLHRRRLVKYTADPTAVLLDPAGDGPAAAVHRRTPGNVRFDGASNGIPGLQARTAGHSAGLVLEPALPDVAQLRPGALTTGAWRLDIDDTSAVVGGIWTVERRRDQVDLVLDVTRGWDAAGTATPHGGGHPGRPCVSHVADDLPLVSHPHPGRPADAEVTVGAEEQPARPVVSAAHHRAIPITVDASTPTRLAAQVPGRVVWRAR
jgi:hypothetical protein